MIHVVLIICWSWLVKYLSCVMGLLALGDYVIVSIVLIAISSKGYLWCIFSTSVMKNYIWNRVNFHQPSRTLTNYHLHSIANLTSELFPACPGTKFTFERRSLLWNSTGRRHSIDEAAIFDHNLEERVSFFLSFPFFGSRQISPPGVDLFK